MYSDEKIYKEKVIQNFTAIIARPKITITPSEKKCRFSINEKFMEFEMTELKPFIVDCEELEIKDEKGKPLNSHFVGGEFLKLEKGLNSIDIKGVKDWSIKVEWRSFI